MKIFFAKKTTTSTQGKNTLINLRSNGQRSFATGPKKNPYSSVLTSLTVGNQKYSLYNLPALQDKRIRKNHQPPSKSLYREAPLFSACSTRVSRS